MKKNELTFLIVALIIAAVFGGLLGEIIGSFLPEGAVRYLFEKSKEIGFDTINLKFYTISLSFGLHITINFVSILMVILVLIYFRWWYI